MFPKRQSDSPSEEQYSYLLSALNEIKINRESKTLWSAALKEWNLFLRLSNPFAKREIYPLFHKIYPC